MSPSVAPVRRSGSIARRSASVPRGRDDEARLTADTIALARQYGRYGYRKITGLPGQAGWLVTARCTSHKRALGPPPGAVNGLQVNLDR